MHATPGPADEVEGRRRVVIEGVDPEIDCGEFPAKAVAGDRFVVEADVFADGHDRIRCVLLYRTERQRKWREVEMESLGNDRWRGGFIPEAPGRFLYALEAWVDRFGTWRHDLGKRRDAEQDVSVDLEIGAGILERVARQAPRGADAGRIREAAEELRGIAEGGNPPEAFPALLAELDGPLGEMIRRNDPRTFATRYPKELDVIAERERAVFSAWYEFFPRSTGPDGKHGTFADAERMLPYIQGLGFDVVYLPPIHPIGRAHRKGPNNRREAVAGDPGSPWAIGSAEGGHDAVHPELGTLEDFARFREKAESLGIEVALDVAFQVSPNHPWVKEHPGWFKHRPDGSIQYAENPPKKYEDIFPLDFESEEWRSLWAGLRGVFEFWIGQGVKIFRVDNPHTKALPFWEWCLPSLKRRWPELIFLSEAFTRPRVMQRLAKLGFTQSYTYFTWRNHRWDLTEYLTELTRTNVRHYLRPNFWPNTPDILHETLQTGGRPAFVMRVVLAATLSPSYGIYGPAFELLEHAPREPGSEEYLDSEKYQLRKWDLAKHDSLRHLITRLNRARQHVPALRRNHDLTFHPTSNEMLLAYSKRSQQGDTVLCIVNLDPHHTQSGWTDLRLDAMGLQPGDEFQVHDVLSDAHYHWQGPRNFVELNPKVLPAHVLRVMRRVRTERDFDYYD